jgi:hypothetical protein
MHVLLFYNYTAVGMSKLMEKEKDFPDNEKYIRKVKKTVGGTRIVVTMLKELVQTGKSMPSLAMDFSFKCVVGSMNEWRVAGMWPTQNRHSLFF